MKKKCLIALSLASALLVLGMLGCSSPETGSEAVILTNQQQGIWVNGQGKVAVVPDVAQITLGIQAQEPTVADAQREATAAMNRVVSALTGNAVASKDIQTQRFSIQVVTRYDDKTQREVVIGYLVTNVVTAKIRALDQTGAIIDAVAMAGGDLTRIEGIAFSIDDPTTYYAQSREKAMTDAKAKAEQIARLSGVTLGKPTLISESVTLPSPVPIKAGTPGQTPISPGEISVIATVQVVYAISE